jgi:hypothetical protein
MYETSLLIQEDFYVNPMEVRDFALSQPFDVKGNYPGLRTKNFVGPGTKESIEKLVEPHAGKITWFGGTENKGDYTGSFQIAYANDRTWIHSDGNITWAGVIYLTPDAPVSAGTGLFKHKKTGLYQTPKNANNVADFELQSKLIENYEWQDYTKWEMHTMVGNKFNRLVLYRGNYFHASLDYFGNTPQNARLFQLFFFNTEY